MRSLLEVLHPLIERTYRMETGIADIHRYVVGDRGLRRLYGDLELRHSVGARDYPEAMVLVRESVRGVHANIYYPDELIDDLELSNPLYGLDARNLDAFAVFVEELDHLLTIADRVLEHREVSLFELELHADVTKYVTSRHFLARSLGRPLNAGECQWLTWSLFEKLTPAAAAGEVRERYRDADRLARRYVRHLDRLTPAARLGELRAFHRRGRAEAVRRIECAGNA